MNTIVTILQKNVVLTAALLLVAVSTGTAVFAQTYQWLPLGVATSVWSRNGSHIYNTNAGSVVVGGLTPSGGLMLDVGGPAGATEFCDENGANCYRAQDMRWELSGTNLINTNTGDVGIGLAIPAEKLHVNGNVLADAFLYSSDQRLKENITPLHGLSIIKQLRPVSYTWKDNSKPGLGFIAQEVQQTLPEIVHQGTDGHYAVDYISLVGPLVAAVQEQQAQIEIIRAEINLLK